MRGSFRHVTIFRHYLSLPRMFRSPARRLSQITRQVLLSMATNNTPKPNWQQLATTKREAVNGLIPKDWRIPNPPSRAEQNDVAGKYLHQYLSKQEVEITESDVVDIAEKTTSGQWKAVEVTKAFCHRAALVHQLVSTISESNR
jgi:hypothetical protein